MKIKTIITPIKKGHKPFYVVLILIPLLFIFLSLTINYFFPFKAQLKYAALPGSEIAYYTRGSGYPLILLSGFGMTMKHWDPLLLNKLSENNELIIFDYRGVGNSTGHPDKSTKEMATDIIQLMDSLKIKKANILGWSLGSFVGEIVAESYPQRVNKLILVSTALGGDQGIEGSTQIANAIQQNLGGSWEHVYVPFLFTTEESKNNYLMRIRLSQFFGESPAGPDEVIDAKFAIELALSNKTDENKRNLYLSSITSSTLIISGKEDKLVPPANSERTAGYISNSKVVIIPQAGHAVLFEKASDVARLIDEFLH